MVELGLIGFSLGHSFSPAYFAEKFKQANMSGRYDLFEIDSIEKLPELLKAHPYLRGFNVTVPYKEQIIPFLDRTEKSAAAIGAVNTVKIESDETGKKVLIGYNTDWCGFSGSLAPLIKDREIKSALVLGTGGAARAVAFALQQMSISPTFVSRNPQLSSLKPTIGYDELTARVMADNLLIVNTTPLGMSPNVCDSPSIPYEHITPNHILYDLIYNPEETEFLRKGVQMGATVKNGLEMLHLQADEAWKIWM